MFNSRKNRHHRCDAPAPRVRRPRSRRLTIEAMENRLLLTGNQGSAGELDYTIWNLESFNDKYQVISQGESLPSAPTNLSTNTTPPARSDLDVSWVTVPDKFLTARNAQQLAYAQYREALSQGLVNYEQSSALYEQWLGSLSFDAGAALVPVYTIGIRNHIDAVDFGGLADLFSDSGFQTRGDNTHLFADSVGSTGSSLVFNSPFVILANNPSVVAWIGSTPLATNLADDLGGPLNSHLPITIDLTHTLQVTLVHQEDAFAGDASPIIQFNPHESSDSQSTSNHSIASHDPGIKIGPVTIMTTEDAKVAALGPTLIIGADGGSIGLAVSTVPAKIETPAPRQSRAEEELDQAIDQLLADDTIIVSHSGDPNSPLVAEARPVEAPRATDLGSAESDSPTAPDQATSSPGATKAAAAYQLAEGGMIPIAEIVDAATREAAGPSADIATEQLAAGGESTELVGELSRVAVMELIEGEAEPEASSGADHAVLIAADRAADTIEAIRSATEQAGLVIASVSPMNPVYFTSIAKVAGHAFSAVVGSDAIAPDFGAQLHSAAADRSLLPDSARSEAFSQFAVEDANQLDADEDSPSNLWLDATPLVVALACERALAARKKRREREAAAGQPAKSPLKAK